MSRQLTNINLIKKYTKKRGALNYKIIKNKKMPEWKLRTLKTRVFLLNDIVGTLKGFNSINWSNELEQQNKYTSDVEGVLHDEIVKEIKITTNIMLVFTEELRLMLWIK